MDISPAPTYLIISLVLPFLGAVTLPFVTQRWRDTWAMLPAFIVAFSIVSLAYFYLSQPAPPTIHWTLMTLAPNLGISFSVEPLGLIFAGVVALLWPLSMLYSLVYLNENGYQGVGNFCMCFMLAMGCALGIAFAADLFTLFVFYELLTLATYPLVTFHQTPQALRGGRIYLMYLLGTSLLLFLPGIVWLWWNAGTLTFVPGGFVDRSMIHPLFILVLVLGIGKLAIFPLQHWLPEAMVAPAPVSALLHAVAVVKAGVFTFAKIMIYVFGLDNLTHAETSWVITLACVSIVVASLLALRQQDLKRRLAYSTVSQLSYIVLGCALLKPAIAGAVFHLMAHAFSKIVLFFAAGAIQTQTGKKRISDMRGLAYQMPWTMACFALAALSLVGLPPTAGFISKWILLEGAMSHWQYLAVAALLISSLLNVAYFAPIIYRAYCPASTPVSYREASPGMVFPMLISCAMVLLLFFMSEPILAIGARLW